MDNKIFVFEYVSGGGFSQIDIPNSLFCEGFSMLRTIIEDFKSLEFEISTLIDSRIKHLSKLLTTDHVEMITKKDVLLKKFKTLVNQCDSAFIIAPESSNLLYKFTKIIKKYDKTLLSTNIKAIKIGSSKLTTDKFFQENSIFTPKTYLIPIKKQMLDIEFIVQKYNELNKPIVVKPNNGVGAESIYFFETQDQIRNFFQEFKQKIDIRRDYILQEYIAGKDLSASLIGVSSNMNPQIKIPLLLSINSQNVNVKSSNYESEYFGGYTPIENHQEKSLKLTKILEKTNFSQFSGYFGIDLIINEDSKFCFIEINPRLTTSYIGLRNVINENPADIIVQSKLNHQLPTEIKILNYSLFSRIELEHNEGSEYPELNEELMHQSLRQVPELVTPPISLNNTNRYSCFVSTKTGDLYSSKKRVQDIVQILEDLGFNVIK
ncbi:MAG: ATP-grasp domain-containing protein [Promethearchaeota archaeon]|jgi:predicted ATP-grasp superfamily ATP-dependent carboligase